ncbi:MAG TPA: hypothetical protein PLJ60_19920 [Chryseolinea sp.]|nr:hypothetical protein [Chryseolinea sp.]
MLSISFIMVINLALIAFAVLCVLKKNDDSYRRDIIKHFGMLELTWSMFSLMLGMAVIFSVLESTTENLSFLKIAGGINTVLLAILFGFGMLHLFFSVIIIFRLSKNGSL